MHYVCVENSMSIDLIRLIQTFGTIHTNYQIDKLMRLNYVMFVFHSIHCKINKINVSMFCIITHIYKRKDMDRTNFFENEKF